jgi:ADP-ribosylglycohydrolase
VTHGATGDAARGGTADATRGGSRGATCVDWDRVEGMMLGLAIGDSLGNPTEGWNPGNRRIQYPDGVRDYIPREIETPDGYRWETALASDDTQLAYWTLEQLLADDGRVWPEHLLDLFCSRRIYGRGQAVGASLRNWEERGSGWCMGERFEGERPWYDCASSSAGNGALMRIAPVLIPHLPAPSRELWADTALAAACTHNDPTSTSACLAFVAMLWELLVMDAPPPAEWWWQRYVEVARDLEGETGQAPKGEGEKGEGEVQLVPRGGKLLSGEMSPEGRMFIGPLWRLVDEYVPRALETCKAWPDQAAVLASGDIWYSGAFLLETVPTVLFILARCADDPEEAIVRAVSDTKDNDTIGAIVGAAAGALHGTAALPERWVTGLKGRTQLDDDGRVFELLEAARRRWGG